MVAGDRDVRQRLVREPGGVGAVHVPELPVDGHESDVDAVRGDGLGDALNPARVARVVDGVRSVADDVADRLRCSLVVGGDGLDQEPSEFGVVPDPERRVREAAGALGGNGLAARGADERGIALEHVGERPGVEVIVVRVAGRDDVDEATGGRGRRRGR